jgi:hypothetical protein
LGQDEDWVRMKTTVDDQVSKIYLFEISGIYLEFIGI